MCIKKHTLFVFIFFAFTAAAQTKPNIIYMMADDLGYADLSCYGHKDYQTPYLDKLASQGIKFINAYATAPVCTPTRVAFMTGRYPARISVGLREPLDWTTKDSLLGLSPEFPSVATLLKQNNYETYLVGKWHLGFKPAFSPRNNGFDYFFGFHAAAVDYISHTDPKGNYDLYENENPVKKDGYLTNILKEKTIEIIKQPHLKPFFISLMFNAPHWPWQGPGDQPFPDKMDWKSGGSPAIYAAMIKNLDEAVGEIMNAVDKAGLANNTVVIFTSDNGGEKFSDMGIYTGGKMGLWEGGIREPAFIRWPGKIRANTETKQVVTTMDWTATILATTGTKPDPGFPLDGRDIMPVCLGKQKEFDRTLYWRVFQRNQHKAMRNGKWKYLEDEKGKEYLFDIVADPGEKSNLREKEKEIFITLKQKYRKWEKTVLTPVPLEK